MKPVLQTFKGVRKNPPSIWLMRQAGRYLPEYQDIRSQQSDFLSMCYNPDIACEVTLQPIRRFHFDAAIIFSDILVIPDALGQKVRFKPDHGPILEPVLSELFIENLCSKDLSLTPVYEAIKMVKKGIPESCTLIGFAGTPWTLATYMIEGGKTNDFAVCLSWIREKPNLLKKLLDGLVYHVSNHLINQINAGAEAVQIFDTWGNIVPEENVETLVIQPFQAIVQNIRKVFPDVPIVYYSRGLSQHYKKTVGSLTNVVLGIDHLTPIETIKANLPKNIPIQGALSPDVLQAGGEPLRVKTQEILTSFADHPLVFNLGHGILPSTPLDHVYQLVDYVRNFVAD